MTIASFVWWRGAQFATACLQEKRGGGTISCHVVAVVESAQHTRDPITCLLRPTLTVSTLNYDATQKARRKQCQLPG
jgi:hypothetical protein